MLPTPGVAKAASPKPKQQVRSPRPPLHPVATGRKEAGMNPAPGRRPSRTNGRKKVKTAGGGDAMGPCQMEAASALLTTSTAAPRQGQAKAARRGAMSARPKGVMRSTPTAPAQRSDKVGGKENPSKSRLPTANQFRCKLRAMMKLMAATHFLLHTAFRRHWGGAQRSWRHCPWQ